MHFIPLKKETSNYSKCSAFAFSAFFHLVFTSNSVSFVEGGRKNISCPRAQGTLVTLLVITYYHHQKQEKDDKYLAPSESPLPRRVGMATPLSLQWR